MLLLSIAPNVKVCIPPRFIREPEKQIYRLYFLAELMIFEFLDNLNSLHTALLVTANQNRSSRYHFSALVLFCSLGHSTLMMKYILRNKEQLWTAWLSAVLSFDLQAPMTHKAIPLPFTELLVSIIVDLCHPQWTHFIYFERIRN